MSPTQTHLDNLRLPQSSLAKPTSLMVAASLYATQMCGMSSQIGKHRPKLTQPLSSEAKLLMIPHRAESWVCNLYGNTGPRLWKGHAMVPCSAVTILEFLMFEQGASHFHLHRTLTLM